ncbi:MAG: sulfatase-like hydrolase/transferase [Deltaproteobacteria bacterium]|nr:sulfatase-like hydrolase/transferase [Deltaproteobacteria bacterium]MBW2051115.1 sulfatase-like hydrolase/transferase [Deltaproteobacteria bacterium]MBW2141397.1 sulfatase-like hydrolase/transferase [Deltaproteobacteria bacterium]MBW2322872.1 sulfatase-like hydrolase/transferase [Deltaproteobacteria bacterium]
MTDKPNIIYIFSDQHRGDTLGSVGHPVIQTPNLDKLASEGVNFTRCSTSSPLCMPARASMMSGQYVCQHGVWNNDLEADPDGPSHVRNIRDAGYHTALIGKTHLWIHGAANTGIHTKEKEEVIKRWGFEDIHELTGPIASMRTDSPYTDYLEEKGLLETHRQYMLDYWKGWASGEAKPWEELPSPLSKEDHLDGYTGRKAVEWINGYEGDKPFYLQVLFPGPHDPFDSLAEHRAMYKPEDMPVGIMDWPKEPLPPYVNMVLNWSGLKGMTPEQKQILRTFYYAKITLIDEYIGLIVKALEEKNMLDNTWIIYNSDHGEMLGDHMMSHKIVFYDGALNIPCVFRPPKGVESWQSEALTDHLDITASLIDIAGARPLEESDGQSLIPKIQEGPDGVNAQKGKEVVFSEVYGCSMAFDGRYKMTIFSGTQEPVELFDLENDPDELTNLANDPALESVRQEFLDKHFSNLSSRIDQDRYNIFRQMLKDRTKKGKGPKWAKGISFIKD